MFEQSTGWIGVDIGSSAVKFAQVERRARKLSVRAAAIINRTNLVDTNLWMRSPPVSSESEFNAAVKSDSFRGRQAACAAPISVCDLRTMEVPSTDQSDIREFISRELSQIHSIPAENVHFDYWRDETSGNEAETNVLCMADRWTNQIISDHVGVGLKCNAVDGLPQSLARATMLANGYEPSRPYAILDWGSTTTTFSVSLNGQPIFTRCLPDQGFRTLESALSQALGMNRNDTRRVLVRHGLPEKEFGSKNEVQLTVAEILSGEIESLVQELRTTIKFFESQKNNISLGHGFMFGSGATLNNIDRWLGSKLNLSLKAWQPSHASNKTAVPLALLGPAIASSTLVWEQV